ncbi:MAG: hypothetical protein ACI8T1_004148, partial [Verrucomicrobiales bacterium]
MLESPKAGVKQRVINHRVTKDGSVSRKRLHASRITMPKHMARLEQRDRIIERTQPTAI